MTINWLNSDEDLAIERSDDFSAAPNNDGTFNLFGTFMARPVYFYLNQTPEPSAGFRIENGTAYIEAEFMVEKGMMPLPFDPKHPTTESSVSRRHYFRWLHLLSQSPQHPMYEFIEYVSDPGNEDALFLTASEGEDEQRWHRLWAGAAAAVMGGSSDLASEASKCVAPLVTGRFPVATGSGVDRSTLALSPLEFWTCMHIYNCLRAHYEPDFAVTEPPTDG